MDSLKLTAIFNCSPEKIYKDWLNSDSHERMTGGEASISGKEGSNFTAWDGYISGSILSLKENKLIKTTWRTTEFLVDEEESIVEISLKPLQNEKTELTLIQTNMPPETKQKYTDGWQQFYLNPMKDFYG